MNAKTTADQRLASMHVGGDLADWVARTRHPAPDLTRSWDAVAKKLAEATNGDVDLNGETIRKWYVAWVQTGFVDRLDEVGAA